MAIVYKHIRRDTNEVFYIGIGSNKQRASQTNSRNPLWHNIVNKTEYDIEIIAEDITIEEAKEIEISLISEFGRYDLGKGSLVNMTDGGDGQFNPSQSTIDKCRNAAIQQHKDNKYDYTSTNYAYKSTQEYKDKVSKSVKEWHKNNSFTDEQRKLMSEGAKKQRSSGLPTHTTPHSDEAKLKMSQARKEYWRKKKLGLL